ncbi:hypothetical protein [Mucilaginibacter sp. L3T2-6]|uniref:beta strand repeat-containing protein n=1 Tax=Mucilaginibacter sp. L3T2-6 TaxID=3062491 RepID=UPI0026754563|nr:hypothetical protein [Mucilaginibacter sp. L3T2-6]MDO3641337.1 hypothetical protein [Mucilaginibacter sp. L3T2-6]MDV6213902.1 hypothetical protein [Mucilaginibacter sp. L3T2-6]
MWTRIISTGASTIVYHHVAISAGSDRVSQSGIFTVNGNFSTAGFTGTYSKTTSSLTIGGDFILGTGSTWSSTSGTITLTSSGTANINTNGVSVNQAIAINGTGSFTLQNNLDCSGSIATLFNILQGTFNANNFNLTVPLFNSSNANVRTINMGSGTWTITGNATTVWTLNTSTNLTFNCNTSKLQFTYSGSSGTRTIGTGSTLVYYDFYITGGADTIVIASLFCHNFNTTGFTGTYSKTTATLNASGDFILGAGSTWSSASGTITLSTTGTAVLNTNGVNVNQSVAIAATGTVTLMSDLNLTGSVNATLTLTSGTFNANNFNITVFSFNGSGTGVRALSMGNGTWTITGNNTIIWSFSTITNLTFSANGSTLQFTYAGAAGTRGFTTGSTTIAYNNISITAGSDTFSLNSTLTANGNFSTDGFTGIFTKASNSLTIGGHFTLGSGSAWSTTAGAITLISTAAVNIDTNGVNVNMALTINGAGSFTLQNNLDLTGTIAAALTVTQGTFNANSYNGSCPIFSSSNSNVRSINMGSGLWTITGNGTAVWTIGGTLTNLTFNAAGSTLKFIYAGPAGSRTVNWGGSTLIYNNVHIAAGSDIFSQAGSFAANGNFSTAGFTGTYSKSSSSLILQGSFTLGMGSAWSSTGGTITLTASSAVSINTNGVKVNQSLNISGAGTFTLQNNLDLSGNVPTTLTVTTGTFLANNFNVAAGFFASNNSNPRTIDMGSGTWTLNGSGGAVWNLSAITNLTLVTGTSSLEFTSNDSAAVTMNTGGGAILYNTIAFNRGAASGSIVIAGDLNCNSFSDTGTAAHTLTVNNGNTLAVNNNWNVTGEAGNLITLTSSSPATGAFHLINLSGAPFTSDYLNIQHSIATPGNYWLAGLNSVNNQDVAAPGAGWAFSSQPVLQAGFLSSM